MVHQLWNSLLAEVEPHASGLNLTSSFDISLIFIYLILGSLFLKNVDFKITEAEFIQYFFLECKSVRFLKQRLKVAFTSTLYSFVVHYQSFVCGIS